MEIHRGGSSPSDLSQKSDNQLPVSQQRAASTMPSAVLPRPVRIGIDCSGMETPVMALKKLKVPYEHMFSCGIDKHATDSMVGQPSPLGRANMRRGLV